MILTREQWDTLGAQFEEDWKYIDLDPQVDDESHVESHRYIHNFLFGGALGGKTLLTIVKTAADEYTVTDSEGTTNPLPADDIATTIQEYGSSPLSNVIYDAQFMIDSAPLAWPVGATIEVVYSGIMSYLEEASEVSQAQLDQIVSSLIDGSPEALNSFREFAEALGNDPDFAATMTTELAKKATKTELDDSIDVALAEIRGGVDAGMDTLAKLATAINGISTNWNDIDGKPSTFPATAHVHPISDVTNLQTELDKKSNNGHAHAWNEVTGKPATFTPSIHTHAISDIAGLQAGLDSKPSAVHTHGISDITQLQSSLDAKADVVGGKIPTSQLPAIALTKPTAVTNRAQMLALTDVQEGDVAVISSGADRGTYMLSGSNPATFSSWMLLASAEDAVSSVNGQTGVINLGNIDVGAPSIQDLTTGLAGKSDINHTHNAVDITGSVTGQVNLNAGTVPNPSDNYATQYPLSQFVTEMSEGFAAWFESLNYIIDIVDNLSIDSISGLDAELNNAGRLTGALTDQVDANEAMVNYEYGGVDQRMPLKELLYGLLYMSELLSQKSDWDHTHTGDDVSLSFQHPVHGPLTGVSLTSFVQGNVDENQTILAALDGKAATGHTHTKAQVGLGNVDNTSDINKPVSTAQQNAINAKIQLVTSFPASPTPGVLYLKAE